MAPYTNMPDDVKKLAEETEAKIHSGETAPLHRPDQEAGRLRTWLAGSAKKAGGRRAARH